MATKADFTEQEWEALRRGALGAGLLVGLSDRSFFDSFREAGALARHMVDARRESDSDLVRELAEGGGVAFGLGDSPAEIEQETLQALRSSVATLEAKAPEEVERYRRFVLQLARSVADAAGGGEAGESAALEQIRSALGATA